MTSVASLSNSSDAPPSLHVDLLLLENTMKESLKKAGLYLGYAVRLTDAPPLASVELQTPITFDYGVPHPIPSADQHRYQEAFRDWAIGQCLIELDQSYQRYLASAIETRKDIQEFITNGRLFQEHRHQLANTWTVHEDFFRDIPQETEQALLDSGYLRSLGNARNCLAHDSGTVTQRRLNSEGVLSVRWRGQEMFMTSPEGVRRVIPRDRPLRIESQDVGHQLGVEIVVREQAYRLGDQISFSSSDLAEIIFFYQLLAMEVGACMHHFTHEAAREITSRAVA